MPWRRSPAGIWNGDRNRKHLNAVLEKLAVKRNCKVNSLEIKELIGEYDFAAKQLYQMDDVSQMMLETAEMYLTDLRMQEAMDSIYGKGFSEFFGQAVKAFYADSREV